MDKLLLKPDEVATALGVSRSRAYSLIASGSIPSTRLQDSKSVRVRIESLRDWIDSQKANVEVGRTA